jgi:hypothetical protein
MYVNTTAGAISDAPPSSNAGEIIRNIGFANTGHELHFEPDNDFFEIGEPEDAGGLGYTIKFELVTIGDITASSSFWIGPFISLGITPSNHYVYPPKAGTIKRMETYVSVSTFSSGEFASINLYLNGDNELTIAATMDLYFAHGTSPILNLPIVETDTLIVEIATPAWSVDPTGVQVAVVLYIE